MTDINRLSRAVCSAASRRKRVEESRGAEQRINSRMRDLSQHGNSLRRELFYKDIHVRIAHESAT